MIFSWVNVPVRRCLKSRPVCRFSSGCGYKSQSFCSQVLQRWNFPLHHTPHVSCFKIMVCGGGGGRSIFLYQVIKNLFEKVNRSLNWVCSYPNNQMCSAQQPRLIWKHWPIFKRWGKKTRFHHCAKETKWELLADGFLGVFGRLLYFHSPSLRVTLPHSLDIRQSDLLLIHFQICPTLHLRKTVKLPLIHKHGDYH